MLSFTSVTRGRHHLPLRPFNVNLLNVFIELEMIDYACEHGVSNSHIALHVIHCIRLLGININVFMFI